MLAGVRVRRDIWRLEAEDPATPWDPVSLAYARAVGVMKQESSSNPVSWSWRYQTQVHGLEPDPHDGLRRQCQHNGWYFLPWHRMYLFRFEAIVRVIIHGLDGVDEDVKQSWALPYWNYAPTASRMLPPAFREKLLPDGTKNPLRDEAREDHVNDGTVGLADEQVSSDGWLNEGFFSSAVSATSFGGSEGGWNHLHEVAGALPGALEITPHGDVHIYVGKDMASFETAGNDAVFWLHHANIDRLWEVWRGVRRQGGAGMPEPAELAWRNEPFKFRDFADNVAPMTPADVLDTESQLGYVYDDVSPPVTPRPPTRRGRIVKQEKPPGDPPEFIPERMGVTSESVVLSGGSETVGFALTQPGAVRSRAGRTEPARVLLNVEHIRSTSVPKTSYGVYIDPADGASDDEYFVGSIPFFGLREASQDDAEHELRYSFDVTEIVNALRDQDKWDANRVQITFRPLNQPALAATEGFGAEVEIGSVSIAYQ